MDPDGLLETIGAIHDSPLRIVLAATGGGMLASSDLLTVPAGRARSSRQPSLTQGSRCTS